ncbi:MAG: 3-hydroxybutyrate dehydrogenase [Phycisphaeraceae bacterium]|nr:3-hydroxybutyrate dehydrogenase [Phycisphaeraceae bacterium]
MTATPRHILVTGAGSGIGRGVSIELARAGHHVIIADVNIDAADETVTLIEDGSNTGAAVATRIDVTCADDIDRFFSSAAGQRVDVLFNNAGLQHVAPLESFAQDKWDQLIDVMVKGTCMMTRATLPGMRQRGFGRIINTGSIHSLIASPFKSAYTAAKHAVHGFTKSVALETADVDITVNTLCPSYVRTPLVEKQIAEQAIAYNLPPDQIVDRIMLEPMPKKAFITFEEITGAIEYLISGAARNLTGQTLVIDGGWTAR